MKTCCLLQWGGWYPASPLTHTHTPPSPVFCKKDFCSARFLLNPLLPHLSPATSPSRAIGAQPEYTGPGSQPLEERKDSSILLPRSLQAFGEGKLRRKRLSFPISQQYKLASQRGSMGIHRERASSLAHPGCLRARSRAATGSLANTKWLPGKLSTLFTAACKCTGNPSASSFPPDSLLVLLICYFLRESLFFLCSPHSPEKAPGLGFPNLVSWVPLACSYFCVLQGLVTRTFWEEKK